MLSPVCITDFRIITRLLRFLLLSTAVSLGALSLPAQQNQTGEVQANIEQNNQIAQNQEQANQPGPTQSGPPATLTIPAGTIIRVRTDEWLSSDRNAPGDTFSAVLDQPLVVDGWVVARRGQSETGTVALANKAERAGGTSQLGVQLAGLTLVDGQQVALQTQMQQSTAGTSHGQEAATVGATTAVGAAIGAVAEGGTGAAIGAGVGAAAGLIGVMATRGKPTVIPPETILSFRLQVPVTINTERSQFAFLPVSQGDYDSPAPNAGRRNTAPPRGPGYPPPPYYYGYPYAYPYAYYPGPIGFGFYGVYGYGPRYGRYRR
jgi:hypothetical protein